MPTERTSARLYRGADMDTAEVQPLACGEVSVFSARCPGGGSPNEDAAAVIRIGTTRGVLAVADGMGGAPAGADAAACALVSLVKACTDARSGGRLREAILDGLEAANRAVPEMAAGAGTTIAAAEIDGATARIYHVGDAGALLVGHRGKIKHATLAHSPTGYAVEAGVLDEEQAMHHAERHLVSNVVGSADMKIEIGPVLRFAARDTLLLASDGVFDNLRVGEIAKAVCNGPLADAAARLRSAVQQRMAARGARSPAKPDDFTYLLYRPARARD
jgi:serine/threonine protein phosphatase PrpC